MSKSVYMYVMRVREHLKEMDSERAIVHMNVCVGGETLEEGNSLNFK